MKNFFVDYFKLCKASIVFSKHHWFGILIIYAVVYGCMYASYLLNLDMLHNRQVHWYIH